MPPFQLSELRKVTPLLSKLATLFCLWYFSASALHGQAAPTATRTFVLKGQIGIAGTQMNPDFVPGTDRGFMIYGDLDLTRYLGAEVLYRNAAIVSPTDFGLSNYLIGPRVRFSRGRFTPYAKFLLGYGIVNFQRGYFSKDFSESHKMYAFGGGVDFTATQHLILRLFDYEAQMWPGFQPHGLTPSSESIGIAYRF